MAEDVKSLNHWAQHKMWQRSLKPTEIPFSEKWTLSPIPAAPRMNEQHSHLTTMSGFSFAAPAPIITQTYLRVMEN